MPAFQPTSDLLNIPGGPPVPMTLKKNLERALQEKGFPRLTFEWSCKSFSGSVWNQVVSAILAEFALTWLKTVNWVDAEKFKFISIVIEQWVLNKGKELRKYKGRKDTSLADIKKINHSKAQVQRHRKKVRISPNLSK